jgi:hemerythrin superfamily protein
MPRLRRSTRHVESDLVGLIEADHHGVQRAVDRMREQTHRSAVPAFWLLADRLVRHELAEELVVYPELRGLPGGDALTRALLHDQTDIERQLTEMEQTIGRSGSFDDPCHRLAASVESHLADEQLTLIPRLQHELTDRQRIGLGRRYASVQATAADFAIGSSERRTIAGRIPVLAQWIRDSSPNGAPARPAPGFGI